MMKSITVALLAGACFLLFGCGVKGDPLPPERPTEIGRGRPSYRRATEDVKIIPTKDEYDDEDDSRFEEPEDIE